MVIIPVKILMSVLLTWTTVMIHLQLVLMSLEQKVVSSAVAILDTQAMVSPVQILVSVCEYMSLCMYAYTQLYGYCINHNIH